MRIPVDTPTGYRHGMEVLDSPVMGDVLERREAYDYHRYTADDVRRALAAEQIGPDEFAAILSPAAEPYLEPLAQRAARETRQHHGNSVAVFTPLYLANYCQNTCTYCGFSAQNRIRRSLLTRSELDNELRHIAATGLKDLLILTGEAPARSSLDYIGDAVTLATRYFPMIGIEIQPLNSDEYAYLHGLGVDSVAVYQETYDQVRYQQVHTFGPKQVFPYRFDALERALLGGMRGVAFGALLGLADFRKDAFATGLHAHFLQRRHPHAEISFSVPRLRPHVADATMGPQDVGETQLLQVMLAYRLFMPYAGITISTRERAGFRDNVVGLVATKVSAGVKVGVGGHAEEQTGDEQFEISDDRTVDQVHEMLLGRGLQPVYRNHLLV